MKTLIVCVSVSHGNTGRIARAIGDELGADVLEPEKVSPAHVPAYDLVGLGSGVYAETFHPRLWRFVLSLPRSSGTPVFLFATSGGPELWWRPAAWALGRLLRAKGYRMVGTYSCRGYDTWLPLRLIGGINRGKPGTAELASAKQFGAALRRSTSKVGPAPTEAAPAPKEATPGRQEARPARKAPARRQPARP